MKNTLNSEVFNSHSSLPFAYKDLDMLYESPQIINEEQLDIMYEMSSYCGECGCGTSAFAAGYRCRELR